MFVDLNTRLLCSTSASVELVVDAEVWPGDIIRVEEDGYGFPGVLGDQLLQSLRQLVVRRRDDAVGRGVPGGAVAVGAGCQLLLQLARLLGLVQRCPEVLAGIRAHVGQFPGDEQRLAVCQVLQHVALGQKVVWAVFTQDAMSQVIQETQEEAARGVGVRAGQVGGGKSVTGPEEKSTQMVEAEARTGAGQDTRQHGFGCLESLGHGVGDALLQLNLDEEKYRTNELRRSRITAIVVNLT